MVRVFVIAFALLSIWSGGVAAQIISTDPNLRCSEWPDGLITCRNERTGERYECRRYPDGRTTCRKV